MIHFEPAESLAASAQPDLPPSDEALLARFQPVFDRIAEGALAREQTRALAYEPVTWLREAGFGAIRVPQRYGGLGASLPQLFRLLVRLGEADSNLPQILRIHFSFVENRLNDEDEAVRAKWLARVVAGDLLGAAMAERTAVTGNSVSLTRVGEGWQVDGEKYYSTGTLYADWIVTSTADGDEHVSVIIPSDAPGVSRVDDWDGFGQRLTGSGTTRFEQVSVSEDQFIHRGRRGEPRRRPAYGTAFLQLVHLAALAGIARAVLRDGVALVQGRTRAFGIPGQSSPRHDPLVQRVIGRLSSLAFAAEAQVEAVAAAIDRIWQVSRTGEAGPELYADAEIRAFQGQQIVIQQVLEAATLLFEAGGASATSLPRGLDRHWRNARTIASHNPAILREAYIGDYYLNGVTPSEGWARRFAAKAEGVPQENLI